MQPRDLVRQTAFAVAILVSVVSVAHATPQYGRAPEVTGPPQWIMQSPAADSTLLLLPNAGFETGTFAGWTVADEAGGSGSWFVYNSGFSPLNGFQIPPPPRGHYAAVTDQRGPGSHLLFRDIAVPNTPSTLTFAIFYENQAGSFSTPPTLDAMGMVGNQQFRVDLIKPSAFIASVAPADVLLNIFQTQVGDPPVLAPTLFTVDLTPFAGQTVSTMAS
jgi:hypothetical protein